MKIICLIPLQLILVLAIISVLQAAVNKELLIHVTTKLQRVILLLERLHSKHFNDEMCRIKKVLYGFEKSFYGREHMSFWCDDPKQMTEPRDILLAAYQRDTICPFHEKYELKHLPVLQEYGIEKGNLFRGHPMFQQIVSDIKIGKSKFFVEPHPKGHHFYTRNNAIKYFIRSVESELIAIYEKQYGERLSLSKIFETHKTRTLDKRKSLTSLGIRLAFEELPTTKFHLRNR